MKLLIPAITALALGFAVSATAQQAPQTSSGPGDASASEHKDPPSNDKGAKPEDMGASGWNGPHRGETSGSALTPAPTPYVPSPSKDSQPPVATGEDLQGQPKAFPSNKTPE